MDSCHRTFAPLFATLLLAACGSPSAQLPALETDASRHLLTCETVIGKVRTPVTYTVTRPAHPVSRGSVVTYELIAPLAQIDTPVSATFVSSDVTFALPAELQLLGAEADPASSEDFTAASVLSDEDHVTLRLEGSFPLEERTREVPLLRVTGRVGPDAGDTLTWRTPESVVATAQVDLFGTQVTRCHFDQPGVIAVTQVEQSRAD